MYKQTRESFIPKGATKYTAKGAEAVAYIYERNGVAYGVGFAGKAQKPTFNYRFRSIESREASIRAWFAKLVKHEATKAERRAAKKAWRHSFSVGDVLRSSWGYDQTNIDWYEVTEVRGATIVIREIAAMREETGWMTGQCAPTPGHYIGEPMTRRPTSEEVIGKYDHTRAYKVEPQTVGGLKVYAPERWSSYA